MSIISDALKKVADKRRGIIRLTEEETPNRNLSGDIKKIAAKKTRWNILSSIGTLFIVGFAITAFLYNTEFLPSFMYPPKTYPVAVPQSVDIEQVGQETPRSIIDKPRGIVKKPEPKKKMQVLDLKLNGVIEGEGEPLAVINNNILRKGNFIEGAQVINITSDRVTLLYGDKEIVLHID